MKNPTQEFQHSSIFLDEKKQNFYLKCPGCSATIRIPVAKQSQGMETPWKWDGNEEKPSLSPSILHVKRWNGCGWHGWLRNGVLEKC